MSIDKLIEKIIDKQNPTVAGLDPLLSYIPEHILEEAKNSSDDPFTCAANALLSFNKGLIDELCDIVPAVKPQSAYYELYGWQGVRAYHETVAYAKSRGLYVIGDVKRGDIGSTAEAYAKGHIGETDIFGKSYRAFNEDAVTVNPYLGTDGIDPFLKLCSDRMIFILVKTSNKSSGEYQDRISDGKTLYELVAENVKKYGETLMGKYGYSAAGAVVGATYPKQLASLREQCPSTFFLVPGYGAQGGGASDAAAAFDKRGLGAVVNSSRGIMCAWKKENCHGKDFAKAARREAIRMKEDLLSVLGGRITY
ncbi:MAG: orotidine-5'-phosphate decarboxylase [Bacillota bacterium]|nr:orotidine-5'-phosphate decarboxylase [Bacillota bacterium]